MANPSPKTDHLESTQFKPKGDCSMGKVIGTRYPVGVEKVLRDLKNHQDYIRQAVEERLKADGLL